ncbi:hypothetical protein DPMN_164347 [Dreissena polymorpha]|uniref:Uncharacterized protein n=1 Tax=Dreissena polymorpha TaxID=45954 RepID=A0A9D4EUZ2_DREPO|nr:hypothetical protein DPMN_164347 [Dreissena polymorpha]
MMLLLLLMLLMLLLVLLLMMMMMIAMGREIRRGFTQSHDDDSNLCLIRRKKFVEIHGRLHQAWDDYEEEKLSTTDLLRTISHINALGPSTAVHHV